MMTQASGRVSGVTGKTVECAKAAAEMLLTDRKYQDALAKLTKDERTELENLLPTWIIGEYKKLEVLRGDTASSAEVGKETEVDVRVRLEEYLGIGPEI